MRLDGTIISLRDFELKDLPHVEHWLHPDHQWQKLDGPYYPKMSAEQIPDHIQKWENRITANKWTIPRGRLGIVTPNDEIIGMVTRYWIGEESNWTAIGIAIWNPEHWGKGFGYQALGLWCDHLFETEPKFTRLDARTWSGNIGMMKLAQKLGFTEEARFRKARFVNDQYYDGMGYGILREEWSALYPNGFAQSL